MNFGESLYTGLSAELTITVTGENSASAWGSGNLPVFATPAMIALMESASAAAVQDKLPPGYSTVGAEVKVRHLSATPQGMEVRARGELTEINGRRLSFKVEAWDDAGKIGEGSHERFIIENQPFLKKTGEKLKK
ncbi:MAG: thioesterase family protein [Treponema sp.]|jgi:predicted thioesterase|nr:thioesterase family protein [Treponema sp.]